MPAKNKQQLLSPENYIKQRSRTLPIGKCWVNKDWEECGMASVLITRNHSNGNVTYCLYMTDILCLGIKETSYFFNKREDEYEEFFDLLQDKMSMTEISYTLAHNIIYAGWEFAEELGFAPHKDFTRVTQFFLEEDSDDIELLEIDCGKDGKPLYVRGPYDSPARVNEILNQLTKVKGKDGFHYTFPSDFEDDDNDFTDDDEYEDDDFENDFDEMSVEERTDLFIDLIERNSMLESGDQFESLITLTNMLCREIIPEESFDYYREKWVPEFEMKISQNKYTHEMLGLDNTIVITEEDEVLLNSITSGEDGSWASLQKLQNKWGDFAFASFLHLQYFTEPNSKDFKDQLSQAVEKYPNNAIIRMEHCAQVLLSNFENCPEIIFENFFDGREEITKYEMFKFQLLKLTYFRKHKNFAALDAMYYLLDDIFDDESGYYTALNSSLIIVRMEMLRENLQDN